tara:strand:+ start:15698 stop:15880 length:183 start_codon:yes stop_codon:yes gene_type:complete
MATGREKYGTGEEYQDHDTGTMDLSYLADSKGQSGDRFIAAAGMRTRTGDQSSSGQDDHG